HSILLDVLLAHHAAPARELIAQELAEFSARHRRRRGAGLKELLAYVGRIEHGDDRVVQFRHHGGRGPGPRPPGRPGCGGGGVASVLRSASMGLRSADAARIGLSLPAPICGSSTGVSANMVSTWPPSRSVKAGAAPR